MHAAVPAISVHRLTKHYGVHAAIDGVSFEVARGEVVGFLGPNGAGKTTTLRILAGFVGATSGRAVVDGHDVVTESLGARRATGYMPEAVPLYGEMRVREYLRFRAELKGVPRRERVAAVGRAMELARVTDVADTLGDHLSRGYRQRVGLADALVAKPRLLILDEPTSGMDPNQIREVRGLIKSLGGEQTVLLSTHILSEVEASCGRVLVIDRGKLVAEGAPADLSPRGGARRLKVVVRGNAEVCLNVIAAQPGCRLISLDPLDSRDPLDDQRALLAATIECDRDAGDVAEVLTVALVEAGVAVREVVPTKTSLEDVFAAVTRDEPSDQ